MKCIPEIDVLEYQLGCRLKELLSTSKDVRKTALSVGFGFAEHAKNSMPKYSKSNLQAEAALKEAKSFLSGNGDIVRCKAARDEVVKVFDTYLEPYQSAYCNLVVALAQLAIAPKTSCCSRLQTVAHESQNVMESSERSINPEKQREKECAWQLKHLTNLERERGGESALRNIYPRRRLSPLAQQTPIAPAPSGDNGLALD